MFEISTAGHEEITIDEGRQSGGVCVGGIGVKLDECSILATLQSHDGHPILSVSCSAKNDLKQDGFDIWLKSAVVVPAKLTVRVD